MQKTTLKIFFLIILFFGIFGLAKSSEAADLVENFYFTQSGGGDGTSCASALAVSWFNTQSNWANPKVSGKIGPGDTAHICGTWTGAASSTLLTVQASGTSGNVIMILFEVGAILQSPQFGANGAININGKDFINIFGASNANRGVIRNTDNGTDKTYKVSSYGINTNGGSDIEIAYLTISDIYMNVATSTTLAGWDTANIMITDNSGNWSNNKVHDCALTAAHSGIAVGFEGINATNVEIYNNYISDHAWMIAVGAGLDNSNISGVDIHGNEMTGWTNWNNPYHTDGLIIFSNGHTNCSYTGKFRDNYVHGNLLDYSPSGFLGTGCGGRNFLIYNNKFICDNNDGGEVAGSCINVYNAGGCYDSQSDPNAGYQPINTMFYNNVSKGTTIQKNNQGGYPVKIARAQTNINGAGQYMQVKNNIFITWNNALHDYNSNCEGFSGQGSSDNNIFYDFYPYSPSRIAGCEGVGGWQTLAQFCSNYGQDCNSLSSNPLLSSSYLSLFGSPAINAGATLTDFLTDYAGTSRPQGSAWDIGAYEYVSPTDLTPPAAPSGLSVL